MKFTIDPNWSPAELLKGDSRSPKATGVHKDFVFTQKTKSGKSIHSTPEHPAHKDFTSGDHVDAYHAHREHAEDLEILESHPNLIAHHRRAQEYHYKKSFEASKA